MKCESASYIRVRKVLNFRSLLKSKGTVILKRHDPEDIVEVELEEVWSRVVKGE